MRYHDPGLTDQQVLDNAIRNVEKQIAVYFLDDVGELCDNVACSCDATRQGVLETLPRVSLATMPMVITENARDPARADELLHMYTVFNSTLFSYFR